MFDELISIYTPVSLLPNSYPKSDTRLLKSELINNWNIFNKKSESDVYNIITAICKEKYEYNAEFQRKREFLLKKWEHRQLRRPQMVELMQEGLGACI